MLLAFPFIAEHNRTSSLGALDETWLSQRKPKAGGVEGALTLYILKYISDLNSWESFFGNVSILPHGFTSNQKAFFLEVSYKITHENPLFMPESKNPHGTEDTSVKPYVLKLVDLGPWSWGGVCQSMTTLQNV